jgi:hypothetical protein
MNDNSGRSRLDQQMRSVLAQLELISSGTTQAHNSGGGGGNDNAGVAGCNGAEHLFWGRQYGPPFAPEWAGSAQDDLARSAVIRGAEADLQQLRGHGISANARPSEAPEAFRERVLEETEGRAPEEVAASTLRVSARTLRKWRREDGRNPETGMTITEKLPPAQRRERVLELASQGLNQEQIARRLGEHHMTIQRDLHKAA